MSEPASDAGNRGPNKFVVAMIVLVVHLAVSLGAAWWMLDEIADRYRQQTKDFLPPDMKDLPERRPSDGAFVVVLRRKGTEPRTHAFVGARDLGDATVAAAIGEITRTARTWRAVQLSAAPDVAPRAEVHAAPGVPTGDIIRVVDACIAAGLADVSFVGTPPPDSELDGNPRDGK